MYGTALYGSLGSGGNSYVIDPTGGLRFGGSPTITHTRAVSRNIEQELRSHLLSITELTDLIGDRIFADTRPQDVPNPMLTMSLISKERRKSLATATGVVLARIQIDTWSDDLTQTRRIADILRVHLEGFSGHFHDGNIVVKRVWLEEEISVHEQPGDGTDDTGVYRIAQDYKIKHLERRPNQ